MSRQYDLRDPRQELEEHLSLRAARGKPVPRVRRSAHRVNRQGWLYSVWRSLKTSLAIVFVVLMLGCLIAAIMVTIVLSR